MTAPKTGGTNHCFTKPVLMDRIESLLNGPYRKIERLEETIDEMDDAIRQILVDAEEIDDVDDGYFVTKSSINKAKRSLGVME